MKKKKKLMILFSPPVYESSENMAAVRRLFILVFIHTAFNL